MKQFVIKLLFYALFAPFTFGQTGQGNLRINVFQNDTGNLKDNYPVYGVTVQITSTDYSFNAFLTKDISFNLVPDTYNIEVQSEQGSIVQLQKVVVSSDQITFVDILFEPEMERSWWQRRKRRKLYSNF